MALICRSVWSLPCLMEFKVIPKPFVAVMLLSSWTYISNIVFFTWKMNVLHRWGLLRHQICLVTYIFELPFYLALSMESEVSKFLLLPFKVSLQRYAYGITWGASLFNGRTDIQPPKRPLASYQLMMQFFTPSNLLVERHSLLCSLYLLVKSKRHYNFNYYCRNRFNTVFCAEAWLLCYLRLTFP